MVAGATEHERGETGTTATHRMLSDEQKSRFWHSPAAQVCPRSRRVLGDKRTHRQRSSSGIVTSTRPLLFWGSPAIHYCL